MCCQMTPAIGIEPMKPITTILLRFMGRFLTTNFTDTRMGRTGPIKLLPIRVIREIRGSKIHNNDRRVARDH